MMLYVNYIKWLKIRLFGDYAKNKNGEYPVFNQKLYYLYVEIMFSAIVLRVTHLSIACFSIYL